MTNCFRWAALPIPQETDRAEWGAWKVLCCLGVTECAGAETVVPGDPGDATVAMDTDLHGRTVWAVTVTGQTYTLQRYTPNS